MQSPHPTYRLNVKRGKKMAQTNEIASFLRHNDKLSPLLPTVKRNISLQKECKKALPAIFDGCEVLNLNEDQLVMSTPNASIAAKLKQQLPKLQAHLQQTGWQINAIKSKVQVKRSIVKPDPIKQAVFTGSALNAFEELKNNLETTPQNAELKAALARLLNRNQR